MSGAEDLKLGATQDTAMGQGAIGRLKLRTSSTPAK